MLVSAGAQPPSTLDDLVPPELRDRLDRLDVLSRRMLAGKLPGERRSKRRGQSVEFDDYRPYIPGDDLRHVDWNVYARFDRFVLKLFREEEDLAVDLLVDASGSMMTGESGAAPSKLVFAHRLAMSLAYLGLVARNRVRVSVFGARQEGRAGTLATLAAVRGRVGVRRVAEFLLGSLARPIESREGVSGSLSDAMRTLALTRASRGVMIVLSDFLVPGGVARGLNYLAGGGGAGSSAGRYDTHCIQVLSPEEMDPSLAAGAGLVGDLRLMDVETGRWLEVTLTRPALTGYQRRLRAYLEQLEKDCLARSMTYLRVSSTDDVAGLILGPLRRRGIVG